MNYYLAPWEWVIDWRPPLADQFVACLDFRSLPQSALAGGAPQGFGFFAYPSAVAISNSIDLGDGLDLNISNAKKNALKSNLGLSSNISAANLIDILWELFTIHADPTGQIRWKPLMPKKDNTLELILNGHSIVKSKKLIPEISPEWNQILAVYQNDYRKIREQGLQNLHDKNLHRKFLQTLVEQFRLEPNKFIPSDLPIEMPLAHETIITENFNKADSTILGPNLTWTEIEGDMDVFSNICRYASALTTGYIEARADSDLSSPDHYSKCKLINAINGVTSSQGIIARKDASATLTYYQGLFSDRTGQDTQETFKVVASTRTLLTNTNGSVAANDIIELRINGSTYYLLKNGTQIHSGTDTAITGNLRCGLVMYSNAAGNTRPQVDDFEAGDLSLIPIFKRREQTLIRM